MNTAGESIPVKAISQSSSQTIKPAPKRNQPWPPKHRPPPIAATRNHPPDPKPPKAKPPPPPTPPPSASYSTSNCVQPYEREAYRKLCHALWADLQPQGAFEEMYAAEILRAAWRLERCVEVEYSLACIKESLDYIPVPDAMQHEGFPETQTAVDRARAQTANHLRRVTAELRALQNERRHRAEMNLPKDSASQLGISSGGAVAAVNATLTRTKLEEAKAAAIQGKITKQSQFSPVFCGSRQ